MRHNPAHTRKAGRGFLRRSTVEPWGAVRRGRPRQRARNRGRNQNEDSNRKLGWPQVILPRQFISIPKLMGDVRVADGGNKFRRLQICRHLI
jgi:hypothetical protein